MEWPWEWPQTLTWITACQVLVSCLGLFWMILRPGTVTAKRLFLGVLWSLACTLVAGAVARQLSGSLFALLSVLFVWIAVVLPFTGIVTSLLARKRSTNPAKNLLLLTPLLGALCGWSVFGEPRRLTLEQQSLRLHVLRKGSQPLRLGILSDIQCTRVGAHEHAAVDMLLAARPDMILLPGDIYQGEDQQWPQVRAGFQTLFQRLVAPGGAFLVEGDCDDPERMAQLVQGTPVSFLHDEERSILLKDRRIHIYGAPLHAPSQKALAEFSRRPNSDEQLRLVLAHRPRTAMDIPVDAPIDLVISGHTHGGQVRLPFGPALIDLSPVPNQVGAGGLHALGHQPIYISRGVGMERSWAPRLRLFCPPEVSLLILE